MSARTDALLSQPETGKMTASIVPVLAGCHPAQVSDNPLRMLGFIFEKNTGWSWDR